MFVRVALVVFRLVFKVRIWSRFASSVARWVFVVVSSTNSVLLSFVIVSICFSL